MFGRGDRPGLFGRVGASRTVTCKVTKTKSAKKIKVTCTVKTNKAKAAIARLTSHGRTIARRTLKPGTRRVTFTITHASHTARYRLKVSRLH